MRSGLEPLLSLLAALLAGLALDPLFRVADLGRLLPARRPAACAPLHSLAGSGGAGLGPGATGLSRPLRSLSALRGRSTAGPRLTAAPRRLSGLALSPSELVVRGGLLPGARLASGPLLSGTLSPSGTLFPVDPLDVASRRKSAPLPSGDSSASLPVGLDGRCVCLVAGLVLAVGLAVLGRGARGVAVFREELTGFRIAWLRHFVVARGFGVLGLDPFGLVTPAGVAVVSTHKYLPAADRADRTAVSAGD